MVLKIGLIVLQGGLGRGFLGRPKEVMGSNRGHQKQLRCVQVLGGGGMDEDEGVGMWLRKKRGLQSDKA